jgi:hypothetical protein
MIIELKNFINKVKRPKTPKESAEEFLKNKANDLDTLFHYCAIFAYFKAMKEGKEQDSEYVRNLCYTMYEEEKLKTPKKPNF